MSTSRQPLSIRRLKDFARRQQALRELAHVTLREAGTALGVKAERARQLFRLYRVPRNTQN
jgi:hypothetical protein